MKKPASPGAAAPPPPTPLHHFFCAAVVRVPDRFTSRSAVPGWARSGRRERESRGGSGRAHLADRWSARSFARMPLPRPPPPPRRSFLPLFPFLHRIYCIVERTDANERERRAVAASPGGAAAEASSQSLASASLGRTDGDRSGCLGGRGGSGKVLAPSAVTCETAQQEHLPQRLCQERERETAVRHHVDDTLRYRLGGSILGVLCDGRPRGRTRAAPRAPPRAGPPRARRLLLGTSVLQP